MYNDISPGFVSIPGFINRVDIRETTQEADYRFRPKKGWIVDWGPSLIARYDFDHTGLRLDTDYCPYFVDSGTRADDSSCAAVRGDCASACVHRISVIYGYCGRSVRPATLGNQDYHEHTSGAHRSRPAISRR